MPTPLLNDVCDIETLAASYAAATGESAGQWTVTSASVPCRIRLMSAGEKVQGRAVYKRASHVIYVPYMDVNPALTRVVYAGRTFRVDGASDMGAARRMTALYVEEYR